MKSPDRCIPRLSVNFHLIEVCNAHCRFCFATFPHLHKSDRLSPVGRETLIDMLVDSGAEKINFAGGEPTLVRDLGSLCERIKTRSQGRCAVSLVTNGARLEPLLEGWAEWIDWVALSVDSSDDRVNVALGRTRENRPYASRMLELGGAARKRGVRVKCNTVVNRLNMREDMRDFLLELDPDRWKLFQMLPVAGENDGAVGDLSITEDEFRRFVKRHEPLRNKGIVMVPENNEAMTNSYWMIGPDGRFFWHVPHGRERSIECGDPILEVGLDDAMRQASFSAMKFRARDGEYDWLRPTFETVREGAES
ncbi:MAG: viperin family antiviral radical SAM protein [bacterium]|nr:viperin family antiviral radical SAM protein [bacterium]MDE0240817.1 viperin family antiviral radical SAM protein [bacterium]